MAVSGSALRVIIAVDGSEQAEEAFDCKYSFSS